MKCCQITMENIHVEDAMHQIDALEWLEPKKRNCLRLLTEEMFSMMNNVLRNREASFELIREDNTYSLELAANVRMTEDDKQTFLSLSSSGKNNAYRGIMGKITAMLDSFAAPESDRYIVEGFEHPSIGYVDYSYVWSMSNYMDSDAAKNDDANWDGMEKSIIANFSDDVIIGVRNNSLDMIVKKTF